MGLGTCEMSSFFKLVLVFKEEGEAKSSYPYFLN